MSKCLYLDIQTPFLLNDLFNEKDNNIVNKN
jgi:hypothetical protein